MKKILIADDHSVVRMGMTVLLNEVLTNASIDEAWNSDSIRAAMKKELYDLVLLDINMPKTDSIELIYWITSFYPATKILVLSMNPEELYGKRYLQLGAMGYLRKTASPDQMAKAVTQVLDGKKYISPELAMILSEDAISGRSANPFDRLSPREFQIALYLLQDTAPNEIAEILKIQYTTVNTHKERIFEKLNVDSRKNLVNLARAYGISE